MHSFRLLHDALDLLLVSGADAPKFLQGQLTCDLQALAGNGMTRGAACNNKGRVIAMFVLVNTDAGCFLVMNKGLGSILLAALQKYQPFYKVSMTLNDGNWRCLALAGPEATSLLRKSYESLPPALALDPGAQQWLCTLSDKSPRYLFCTTLAQHPLLQQLDENLPVAQAAAWEELEMLEGHFPFTPTDSEQFTPQELNLDRAGYVSFSKGCYTGQEIVARMHYRGKAKRQLYLLEPLSETAAIPAQDPELLDAEGATAGKVIKQFATPDGRRLALASLPIEFAESQPRLFDKLGNPFTSRPFGPGS